MRATLKSLLKDYSLEEICEIGELEPIEALELLIVYGALDLKNIVTATDGAED